MLNTGLQGEEGLRVAQPCRPWAIRQSVWKGHSEGVHEACMLTRGLRLLISAEETKRCSQLT